MTGQELARHKTATTILRNYKKGLDWWKAWKLLEAATKGGQQ